MLCPLCLLALAYCACCACCPCLHHTRCLASRALVRRASAPPCHGSQWCLPGWCHARRCVRRAQAVPLVGHTCKVVLAPHAFKFKLFTAVLSGGTICRLRFLVEACAAASPPPQRSTARIAVQYGGGLSGRRSTPLVTYSEPGACIVFQGTSAVRPAPNSLSRLSAHPEPLIAAASQTQFPGAGKRSARGQRRCSGERRRRRQAPRGCSDAVVCGPGVGPRAAHTRHGVGGALRPRRRGGGSGGATHARHGAGGAIRGVGGRRRGAFWGVGRRRAPCWLGGRRPRLSWLASWRASRGGAAARRAARRAPAAARQPRPADARVQHRDAQLRG